MYVDERNDIRGWINLALLKYEPYSQDDMHPTKRIFETNNRKKCEWQDLFQMTCCLVVQVLCARGGGVSLPPGMNLGGHWNYKNFVLIVEERERNFVWATYVAGWPNFFFDVVLVYYGGIGVDQSYQQARELYEPQFKRESCTNTVWISCMHTVKVWI